MFGQSALAGRTLGRARRPALVAACTAALLGVWVPQAEAQYQPCTSPSGDWTVFRAGSPPVRCTIGPGVARIEIQVWGAQGETTGSRSGPLSMGEPAATQRGAST